MNYNKSLMSDLQTYDLDKRVEVSTNGIDFNFQGFNSNNDSSELIKYGTDANINRVLFWFSTKRNDYTRSVFKGGILYDLLGELNSNTNLEEWERTIQNRFNDEFSNDLSLLMIKLIPDKMFRKLRINMVVQDRIENRTFPISTEAKL